MMPSNQSVVTISIQSKGSVNTFYAKWFRKTSHFEEEPSASDYAVLKFHLYLQYRKFITTDQKMPVGFLGQKKTKKKLLTSLRAAHIQKCSLISSAYNHKTDYKSDHLNENADGI